MPGWKPGQSGNPKGRAIEQTFREAVKLAVNEVKTDGKGKNVKKLRLLAQKLVDEAIEGNIAAIKEVADRLDGKAKERLEVDATESALALFLARAAENSRAMPDDDDERPTIQ